MAYQSHKDLRVWQEAMALATAVYGFVKHLPDSERFCMQPQILRAVVSVPSNIAEGHGRGSNAELRRYCGIALGSLAELETIFLIAEEVHSLPPTGELFRSIEKTRKMLYRLRAHFVAENRSPYGHHDEFEAEN